MKDELTPEQQQAHDLAVEQEERTYVDPHTGHRVMTSLHLETRGWCCCCGCRHCPWDYVIPATCDAGKER